MNLKIAILGTRGIPNHYGGYEQAVTFLSEGLVKKGHTITVYNSHNHPWQENTWNGVEIIHCYDPEYRTGSAGQFIYDLNCIRDARRRNYDVLLLMGYTSSSVWGRLYPKKPVTISNMDGLEWKRSKYSKPVQAYLQYAEKLAVRFSDYFIADSPAIKSYLDEKYRIDSHYIPYGAVVHPQQNRQLLMPYGVEPGAYYMLIARIEPENNIDNILEGFLASDTREPFMVIGNTSNRYGRKMIRKFKKAKNIRFMGAIYDQQRLHCLRCFCSLYFHGHSVGGTNPSLLEAMASGSVIAAHDNPFNKAVLGDDAFYFSNSDDIKNIIGSFAQEDHLAMKQNNLRKINDSYSWEKIITQYEQFILQCFRKRTK
jgi:glycosyltransferase involved in cell wall biosynthesis